MFAGLPAAALASGWRSWRAGQHRFGLYSAGTAVTMFTAMALAGAGFGQSPRLINIGGLFQRASIITGFAWLGYRPVFAWAGRDFALQARERALPHVAVGS